MNEVFTNIDLGWFWFSKKQSISRDNSDGKWMAFFADDVFDFCQKICKEAIKTGVVDVCKVTNPSSKEIKQSLGLPPSRTEGLVICFYANSKDLEQNKKILKFMIDNQLIRRTKAGKLYNISFKFNSQTKLNLYNDNGSFQAKIRLSDYMDLDKETFIEQNNKTFCTLNDSE